MPLYVVRWHAGPLPTTLLENLILLTGALYVLTLWRHHEPLPKRTPYDIPVLVSLVAGVVVTGSHPANPSDVAAAFAGAVQREASTCLAWRPNDLASRRQRAECSCSESRGVGLGNSIVQTRLTPPKELWGTIQLLRAGGRTLLGLLDLFDLDVGANRFPAAFGSS